MATPAAADATATPPPPLPDEAQQKIEEPGKEEAAKIEESPAPAPAAPAPASESGNGEAAAEAAKEGEAPEEVAAPGPVDDSLPSFKEESYFEKDLKESEKKALHELSDKVEAAIKAKEFVLPPKVEVVKETTEVAKVDEAVIVATTIEKDVKEGDLEVKIQEAAVAVIAPEEAAPELPLSEAPKEEEATTTPAASSEAAAAPEPTSEEVKAPEAIPKVEETPKLEETPKVEEAPKAEETPAVKEEVEGGAPEAKAEEPKIEEAPLAAPIDEAPKDGVIVAPPLVTETTQVEEDTAPPEDLELWGVPLLPSKGDPRTQVIFLKFLRARDFKVKDAFAMLKNCVLWRKRYGADKILEEDLGTEFEASAFNHGVDKEGHPVQYNDFGAFQDKDFYQKVFGDAAKTEKALRWRVQLLEKQIQSLNFNPGGVTSMLQVVDMKNAPLLGKKGVRLFMSQALKLLTDNYPELVVKIVLLNTPWYFSTIYAFISPFFTQRTKSKFTFGGSSLFKFISPDNIPVQYGGLSRANDTEFGGDASASVTELVLKAGEKKTASIEVSGAGDTVVWEFALVGSDVTYGAEFVPSKEGGYTTIVVKPKKITSLEEPIRNTFKSPEPGNLVLSVDNTLSRKKKTALYRYIIKPPPAAV
ncbi:patellin-6 [Selaginella moellendorffii]|uniref:patellin-6 n=1 Tax=Selaginella moellendorffii TaxID=88036 RepID=UPI000D1CD322|nr:patellin-6 [Selaginella moellendorffii]|eukprot:XP_024516362.1 patellin-6 [Selaginella moellendorffii]